MPRDSGRRGAVQDQPVGTVVMLPHAACDVVSSSEIVTETFSVLVDDNTTFSAQGFGGEELDSVIGVIKVNKASRMYLNVLEIDGSGTNLLSDHDTVTGTVFSIGGWEVHKIGTDPFQQTTSHDITGTKTTGSDDDGFTLQLLSSAWIRISTK
jgi:hypothetical protein